MNLNLFSSQGRWLMVDCGITFEQANEDHRGRPSIQMPDPTFISSQRDQLDGLVVTHAHEDHFGAIPYLWQELQCPVYATPFAAAVLRKKAAWRGAPPPAPLIEVLPGDTHTIGSFDVTWLPITHSTPETCALLLESQGTRILHTADWKIDAQPVIGSPWSPSNWKALASKGIDAVICDSTNATTPGRSPTEGEVGDALAKLVTSLKGRVVVACFASNVARLGSIMTAAAANNRSICVVGRALNRTIGAARDTGYLADIPDFVSESEASLIPRNHMVIICTGSQGETRAAMAKIAAGTHESVELQPGDTVIYSSRQIPGNEPAITKVQDMLVRRGIHLITDEDRPVHVSGHPARDELVEMYGLVRPQIAIPVHGTARHLMAHAELANNCQVKQTLIPDNGAAIRLKSGTADIIGYAPVGLLTSEGGEVVDLQSDHLRSRRRMLWNGTVTATVVLSAAGELLMAPQVSQTGLCPDHQSADFIADAGLAVEDVICQQAASGDNDEVIEEMVRRTVRQMAKGKFKLRPTVHVHVMRTDITGVSA